MNNKLSLKEIPYLSISMLFIAIAVHFFLVPSQIVVGSVSGLAMVLGKLTNIPISMVTLVLNIILLILGFIFVGKEFGAKTVYTSILLPLYIGIFEHIAPITTSITGEGIYDLITYILLISVGQAMLFRVGASSGGLDIAGKIVSKYTHIEIGKALTITGFVTSMSSILVYDLGTLIVSLIGTYANGLAVDYFIEGFNKKKKICIICDDYEPIQNFIMNDMKRGVTIYTPKGAYAKKEQVELVTIMTTNEYKKLLDYLYNTDIKVFVTISTVNEVIGTWNKQKRK